MLLIIVGISFGLKLDKEDSTEKIKVIITLKDNSFGVSEFNKKQFRINMRENIVSSFSDNIKVKHRYNIINGFSAEITEEGLEELINNSNILNIKRVRPFKVFLNDSVNVIQASDVHSRLFSGNNVTGSGVGVCVLDTGINYTHESFGGCSESVFLSGGCARVLGGYDFVNMNSNPYDDHGHGTHVSGIVGGNGNIKGVAPTSKILAVKVMDSGGSGDDADIIAGIEWCIGNKTNYNISVISMSFGTPCFGSDDSWTGYCYASYCNDDILAVAINNAVSKNITVVAATGNDGNYSYISSPACIESTLSVGASNKNDNVASFSNRNNLTEIFAPGMDIFSTSKTGEVVSMSGTSQAAPHVAGVIALIQQYAFLEKGIYLNYTNVWDALNKSKVNIIDSTGSGLTFKRLDAFDSIVYIDKSKPSLIIDEPQNKNYDTNVSLNLKYVAQDTFLENVFYSLDLVSNITLSGNITFNISRGVHTLYMFANDSNGNLEVKNVTFTVLSEKPYVVLNSPENNKIFSGVAILNCSATDDISLSNISLYGNFNGNFSLNQTNSTNGLANSSVFIYNLGDGSYLWNCLAYDNDSNFNFASSNYSFTVDNTPPYLDLISPANYYAFSSSSVTLKYNVNDTNTINNCSLYVGNVLNSTSNSVSKNTEQSFSLTFANGDYTWKVGCYDAVGNYYVTGSLNFKVSASIDTSPSLPSSPSGGGGNNDADDETSVKKEETKKEETKVEENKLGAQSIEENVEKPKVITDEIKNALGILFDEDVEDANFIKDVEFNRNFDVGKIESPKGITGFFTKVFRDVKVGDVSTLKVEFKYQGEKPIKNFIVYDKVPKEFADNSDKITVRTNGKYEIIERDPLYIFLFSNVDVNESRTIYYDVNGQITGFDVKSLDEPLFLTRGSYKKSLLWLYTLIGFLVVASVIFQFAIRRRNIFEPEDEFEGEEEGFFGKFFKRKI